MRYGLLAVVVLVLLLATAGIAHSQSEQWKVQTADDETTVATIATDHLGRSGRTIVTLLNVGFAPNRECQPEIGIAMLEGSGYGKIIGKISPPRTEPIQLTVDDKLIATQQPFLVKYDNGLEVMFPADAALLGALTAGTTAIVQLVSGTPKFEFTLTGAGEAFAAARKRCISGH